MKKKIVLIMLSVIFILPVSSQQKSLPLIEDISGDIMDWASNIIGLLISEDVIVSVGVGKLSTNKASMEQANFNAHVDLCRQLATYIMYEYNSIDVIPKDIVDRLYFYQDRYYDMISMYANYQACFELYGLTTVERRARTSDGQIYYIVSFEKKSKEKLIVGLQEYVRNFFTSTVEEFYEE
jgi:hypothetical protein